MNAMTLPIDKAGRIVLPKAIRERWHLEPGVYLELEERQDGLILRPAEQRPSMVQENGTWVHLGKPTASLDWDRFGETEREQRIKEITAL
jgi:AbrB family looped-hinge helix DNA binding protein